MISPERIDNTSWEAVYICMIFSEEAIIKEIGKVNDNLE